RHIGASQFVYHGTYDAADIVRRLRSDRIDVGLQLSVWREAFSFTLSEFVEAGIPVIAGRQGAQGERIDRAVASMRRAEALIPVETMWHVYAEIYESVAVPRQAPAAAPEACRQYVTHLSAEWHDSSAASLTGYETELLGLRQLLRSPRYRFADALATGLMRIPGLWQVITKAQDALDRRTNRRS